MYCQKCGKEIPDGAKFCTSCGAPTQAPVFQPVPEPAPAPGPQPAHQKKKKRSAGKIILGVILLFIGIGIFCGGVSNALGGSPKTEAGAKPDEKPSEVSEADYKASCIPGDYEELSRNPDKHKGEYVTFTGKVMQVQEVLSTTTILINVTQMDDGGLNLGIYEDPVYCTVVIPEGESRILQEDMVTVYGEFQGLKSYMTVLGAQNTIPELKISYFEIMK